MTDSVESRDHASDHPNLTGISPYVNSHSQIKSEIEDARRAGYRGLGQALNTFLPPVRHLVEFLNTVCSMPARDFKAAREDVQDGITRYVALVRREHRVHLLRVLEGVDLKGKALWTPRIKEAVWEIRHALGDLESGRPPFTRLVSIQEELCVALAVLSKWSKRFAEKIDAEGVAGYLSADTLLINHGIHAPRLSEKATKGLVRTKGAPRGLRDSEGRQVRKLYHEQDALRECSPQQAHGVSTWK
ncbi:MAG: hypothetical protein ACE5E5_14290 [Phycisphaerae bacterium]